VILPIKDDNPTRTVPFVTISLVVLNSAIYLYQMFLPEELVGMIDVKYGVVPAEIIHALHQPLGASYPVLLTLITSQFLHGSILHVGGNMLYLWIFGNNIEDILGHFRFIFYYLICGVIAGAVFVLSSPNSAIPTIGASGAISGILGAYLIRFPRARVLVVFWFIFLIRLIYVPAALVLGFWIFIQVVSAMISKPGQGGIAWYAHVGGFVAGIALLKLFEYHRRRRWKHIDG
jgi:membrane associated rhomboid family serine protease